MTWPGQPLLLAHTWVSEARSQRPAGAGAGAGPWLKGLSPMDETQDTEVKPSSPRDRWVGSRSVLKVSQLLLRAIASHKRPTLAALKKEFGNVGYEVRRNCGRLSGEKCRSEGRPFSSG